MEKFTKLNETSVIPDPKMFGTGDNKNVGAESELSTMPVNRIDSVDGVPKHAMGINLDAVMKSQKNKPWNKSEEPEVTFTDEKGVKVSEPCKFVSKIFESRQMANVYHLQAKNEGGYAKHKAMEEYYEDMLELLDTLIEVYQGQYEIIEDYETIKTENRQEEPVQYFLEVVEFIKSTRKLAFLEEDTHLHNIIDEMVALLYRTVYKLKYLK